MGDMDVVAVVVAEAAAAAAVAVQVVEGQEDHNVNMEEDLRRRAPRNLLGRNKSLAGVDGCSLCLSGPLVLGEGSS